MPVTGHRYPSTADVRTLQRYRRVNRFRRRTLLLEALEDRQMMDSAWQNSFNPRDVTGDGVVVPLDVLNSINELNNRVYINELGKLPDRAQFPTAPFYDFNGDGLLSPVADVLPIINGYNGDDAAPTIVVALFQDTAPGGTNSDSVTKDQRLAGTLTDVTGISRFVASVDNGPEQLITVAQDGTFQFNPGLATDGSQDGQHSIKFVGSDGRRNVSTPFELLFTLDTVGPSQPTTLQLDGTSDTGASSSDGITNDNTPTIRGDAPAGTVIQALLGTQIVGQTTANSPWSITTDALPDGEQTLVIKAFDPAGNTSANAELHFTIDTTAPAVPSNLRVDGASDSGSSNTDGITNDKSPTVLGSAEAGASIAIRVNGQAVTSTTAAGGNWQFTSADLADGNHLVTAIATDLAGNSSAASTALQITVDTAAPAVPLALQLAAASDTGLSNSDRITKDTTPTFNGTSDAGVTVTISIAGQAVGTTSSSGNWTITTTALNDGTHDVSSSAVDLAGNASAASASVSITVDSTSPTVPSNLQIVAASDTGKSQTDRITKDNTPTIAGSAEAGTTVTINIDGTKEGTVAGGNWQFTTPVLSDGQRNVVVFAEDVAGNVSSSSSPLVITIDTVAPSAPTGLSLDSASDTGASNTDGITRLKTPTYIVEAESGALVRLFIDDVLAASGTANSPVSLTAPSLSDGQHSVFAKTEDDAGNLSAATATIITVVDTVGPGTATLDLSATSDTATLGDRITSAGRVTLVGRADANSQVKLTPANLFALAAQSGDFQFTGVPLSSGDNVFVVETSDVAGNVSSSQVTFARVDAAATVDPVLRWNQSILEAIRRDASAPPVASRFMAMMHIAVLDAVSNIDGTPSYLVRLAPPAGASATAAVTAAAHRILSYAYPAQTSWFDVERTAALAEIPDGASKTSGINFGTAVAEAVIQLRDSDGWNHFQEYTPGQAAGDWQQTAPMYEVALLPQWADLEPFAMTSTSQFRPSGPPALSSAAYAAAFNDVKQLGRITGSTRTAEQTSIARFWADGSGTFTPPGHWNDIAGDIAADRGNSLAENARLFAILNIALADASITAWNTKFHYELWRPTTAIQQAGLDGNDQTEADGAWQSFLITPPFPEYVSGHSTYSGAASEVLSRIYGNNVSFTTNSPGFVQADGVTPVQRSFTSFEQAAVEAGRSRVYGGIHFEFANQDGLAAGRSIADYVWDKFSTATDTQAPRVVIISPQSNGVVPGNFVLTGRVLDNLSGVQSLQASMDGGAFTPVNVAPDGSFSVATTIATNGSADGVHHLRFKATDFLGNSVTTSDFDWTLDTQAPALSITSAPGTGPLAGTVNGTGSNITLLTYRIDDGQTFTMSLPNSAGEFSTAADLSRLAAGDHTVTVTATDAAGRTQTASTNFNLASRIPFRITSHTPTHGADDIGSTYRPQIFFSRPVDRTTLTESNFFATDSSGATIPATVVAGLDGTFAWLFFDEPLPGASTITMHVVGSTIAAAGDAAALDADSDGQVGGTLTYKFSTVSLSPLPGTSLSGKVVDPGVDLKPMTFDDVRPGPDGILHTADDRFLLPIAGVKVFILGLEDDFVLTDAQGNFQLSSVPSGNVKLAIDGRTATNEPNGIYFPEMVMDLTLQVGVANTVMGTMGSREEMAANIDRPEVYLPRLQLDILQPVSNTENTLITADGSAAPNLSDAQRQFMTLEVQPQSLIGPDGLPVVNGQVGISTVPPELVRDMLPPGLLQHTFDITIQSPEAATFAAPLTLTLPNVFNAPPGTKLNFLSFDHTTGRLVIEGTGTVSEDGLSVTTDAGTGITKPGWHGFTPPVTCAGAGAPPAPPKPPTPNDTFDEKDEVKDLLFGENGTLQLTFKSQQKPPSEDPPQNNGCPSQTQKPNTDPYTTVNISVDGPIAEFMKAKGADFKVDGGKVNLPAGSPDKKYEIEALKYIDMFKSSGGGLKSIEDNYLYGSKIKVTVVEVRADGSKHTKVTNYYLYRFVDATDDKPEDKTITFEDTLVDGLFGVERDKNLVKKAGGANPTVENAGSDRPFFVIDSSKALLNFDPEDVGQGKTTTLRIKTPKGDVVPGTPITLKGDATPKQKLDLNLNALKGVLAQIADGTAAAAGKINNILFTPTERGYFATDALRSTFVEELEKQVKILIDPLSTALELGTGDNTIKVHWVLNSSPGSFGDSSVPVPGDGVDLGNGIVNFLTKLADYSKPVQNFIISGLENQSFATNVTVYPDNAGEWSRSGASNEITSQQFVNALAKTAVHEAAHTLGAAHASQASYSAQANERQRITITNGAAGDTFKLTFVGQTTAAIAHDASSQDIVSAIGALSGVGQNVLIHTVSPGVYEIEFDTDLQNTNFPQMTATTTGAVNVAVTTVRDGRGQQEVPFNMAGGQTDIMFGGRLDLAGDLRFRAGVSLDVMKVGLHIDWTPEEAQNAIKYLVNHRASAAANGKQWYDSAVGPEQAILDLPAVNAPLLAVIDSNGNVLGGVFDFGIIIADGSGNTLATKQLQLLNFGDQDLEIQRVTVTGAGFTGTAVPANTVLAPGSSTPLTITFDPQTVGDFVGALTITSNASETDTEIALRGKGRSATPKLTLSNIQNNLGGAPVGATITRSSAITLINDGAQPLTITGINVEAVTGFSLTGVPADLNTNPIVLQPSQSITFGARLTPESIGLQQASVTILSSDPSAPQTVMTLVGTGLPDPLYPQWGDDYVAVETPPGANAIPVRVRSDSAGNFQAVIGTDQAYHVAIFDPITGLIAHGYGQTPAAGGAIDLTSELVFDASVEPDLDFDGLPDDVEWAIGTAGNKVDTDEDGFSDGVELQQGWDPLDANSVPLGVIASLPLLGESNEVVLEGSFTDAAGQTAYIATGSYGLAIVNASKFYDPIILSQLNLTGTATDVAVDTTLQLAVVAANAAGAQVLDISDPRNPTLLRTYLVQTSEIEVLDGVGYITDGTKIQSFDLVTGAKIQELDLEGNTIVSLTRERAMLYSLDTDKVLRAIDISGPTMVRRDSLTLPVAGTDLFVGGGIAYVGDSTSGGLATVNVANFNDLVLISGPDSTDVVGTTVVANGSGGAISIGNANSTEKLQLLDVSPPSETGQITKTFVNFLGQLRDVTLGGGFGYVAAGTAGLLTVNFMSLDTSHQVPTVDLGADVIDLDIDRPGIQVREGATVPLLVSIQDDVQIRNVELLVDGVVVRNDVSFPFDFSAIALSEASNGQVRIQVRATDTGGNFGLSRELIIEEVADTTPPTVVSSSPIDGATRSQRTRTVQFEFSESMDISTLVAANIQLRGPGGTTINPLDVQVRNDDRFVQLTYPTLDAGAHQVILKAGVLKDRAGNALGSSDVTTSFTVTEQAISWISSTSGDWNDPGNWDQGVVPGPFDHVVIDVPENITVFYSEGTTQIASLYSSNRFILGGGRLIVDETVKVDNQFLLSGGTLQDATVLAGANGEGIIIGDGFGTRLDHVTVNANIDLTSNDAEVRIANGLTLNGVATVWGQFARVLFEGSQTITSGHFDLNSNGYSGFGFFLSGLAATAAGTVLTLGPNVLIEGHGQVGAETIQSTSSSSNVYPFLQLINQGTIEAGDPDDLLEVTAAQVLNQGTLRSRLSSFLSVEGLTGNVNTLQILDPGSAIELDGLNYVVNNGVTLHEGSLFLSGTWSNAVGSTITATNSGVTLGSSTGSWTNLGTINVTESETRLHGAVSLSSLNGIHQQGGKLDFAGVLDNRQQTLDLDTFAADWPSSNVLGGTIDSSNSQAVTLASSTTNTTWNFTDVAINTDLVVPDNITLHLHGDWKNNAKITVNGGILRLHGEFTAADLGDVETINGGIIEIEGILDNTAQTIHLDNQSPEMVLVGGTIRGGTITFGNSRSFEASSSGGTLDGVTVQGNLELTDYFATLTIAGGTTFDVAHLRGYAAALQFVGDQTLTGTVVFDVQPDCANCWHPQYIRFVGDDPSLTIASTGVIRSVAGYSGQISIGDNFNFEDDVTLINQGTIAMTEGGSMVIDVHEFNNNGAISVGPDSFFTLRGLTGNLNQLTTDPDTWSITLDGDDYVISQDIHTRELTLDGTWTNQATITVEEGVSLNVNSPHDRWQNPGSIETESVYLQLDGIYTSEDLDNIDHPANTGILGGTLDNTGESLAIDQLYATWDPKIFGSPLVILGGTLTAANNQWTMDQNSRLRLDSVVLPGAITVTQSAELQLSGAWKNPGAISVHGILNLGGTIATADLGTITNLTGAVLVNAEIENTGATLALNDQTGTWTMANTTIHGGTLDVADGTKASFEGQVILDDVDVLGDIKVVNPINFCCVAPTVILHNGTTFNKIILQGSSTGLRIGTNQTITGEVLFGGDGSQTVSSLVSTDTLTIAATGAIRTAAGYSGTAQIGNTGFSFYPPFVNNVPTARIINEGTIESNQSTAQLFVNPLALENRGTLRVSNGGQLSAFALTGDVNSIEYGAGGGKISLSGHELVINDPINVPAQSELTLNGHWTNESTITSTDAIVTLGGSNADFGTINATNSVLKFTGFFAMDDLATINRTGGSIDLLGTLDNTGKSIVLDTLAADWKFHGTIMGGAVSVAGANFSLPAGTDLTLADVQLTGTIKVPAGTQLTLSGDWSASGSILVEGGDLYLEGGFSTADLASIQRTDGRVSVRGFLDNTGATLTLNNSTGSWRIDGGSIFGGVVQLNDGQTLNATANGGSLVAVTVHGDLQFSETSARLALAQGTTFTTARLAAQSSTLELAPNEHLRGNVLFEGAAAGERRIRAGGLLTVDAGSTIRTAVGFGGSASIGDSETFLVQQGRISSEAANRRIQLTPRTMINSGRLESSNNGILDISAANWENTGILKTDGGVLNLDGVFSTSSISGIQRTGGTINVAGWLNNHGSTIGLNAASGSWNVSSGTIYSGTYTAADNATLVFQNSSATLDNLVANGPLNFVGSQVWVRNGLTVNGIAQVGTAEGSSKLLFEGIQSIDGTGQVVYGPFGDNAIAFTAFDSVLTIGPGIVVRGGTGRIGGSNFWWLPDSGSTVINRGKITAEAGNLFIGSDGDSTDPKGNTFQNFGTVEVKNGAELFIGNMLGNTGNISLPQSNPDGASLIIDGKNYVINQPVTSRPNSQIQFLGSWTNAAGNNITVNNSNLTLGSGTDPWHNLGRIAVTDSNVNLDGEFTFSDLGVFERTGTNGTTNLRGTLKNQGQTLALNATTGSWRMDGGKIRGGTITYAGGASLTLPSGASGTFDGVTLADNTVLQQNFALVVMNGLTLDTANLLLTSVDGQCCYATVTFQNTQSILGQGEIQLESNSWGYAGQLYLQGTNPNLTVGSQITIKGAGTIQGNGTLTNLGTIIANKPQVALTIDVDSLVNQGTIRSENDAVLVLYDLTNQGNVSALSNSDLSLEGNWSNASVIDLNNATLHLGGTFQSSDIGTLNRTGSVVNLVGTLDNTGNTFVLNSTTGSWNLLGGRIKGGEYSAADGASLVLTPSGGTLDGLTAKSDLDLSQTTNAYAHIRNGLTLDNAEVLIGNALGTTWGGLYFDDANTLGGTGTITFGKNGNNFLYTYNSTFDDLDAGKLTIGPNVTIRGNAGAISDGYYAARVLNQGKISADGSGGLSGYDYDRYFFNGSQLFGSGVVDTSGVTDPATQLVYQSARSYGEFSYVIDGLTAGNSYNLRLHFAELLELNAGERKFHVTVNGTRVLDDFDIVAEAGARNKAVVREFAAVADANGKVTIDFNWGSQSSPLLNAIELLSGATRLHSIDAGQLAGGTIRIDSELVNNGTLEVHSNEILEVNKLTGNAGNIDLVGPNSWLDLNGTNYVLNQGLEVGQDQVAILDGTWSNTGTLKVVNGAVNLAGTFSTAGLGTMDRSGGEVNLTGMLENAGNTLALNASTGSWNLAGGTIQGGSYSGTGAAKLVFTNLGGTLDGITARSDLELNGQSNAHAHVLNGLTLDDSTIWIGDALGLVYGGLMFHETSTLGGTGEVVFGKNTSNYLNVYNSTFDNVAMGTLTIGPNITIRGSNGSMGNSWYLGQIVNEGKISADDSGGASGFDYDRNVSGGSGVATGLTVDTTGVVTPAPQLVYQSARTFGAFNYELAGLTAGSDYTLRLHFAEIMDVNVGERKFHVSVNGTRVLDDFDIRAEAGAKNKAIVREITATADPNGKVTVSFDFGSTNSPLLNGLELLSGATVLHEIDAGHGSGGTISIQTFFTNHGDLEVHNGEVLDLQNIAGNAGNIELFDAGSRVTLNGTDYVLDQGLEVGSGQTATLNGTWSNLGTIKVTDAEVNLGGTFSVADLGTMDRTGGTVNLTGTLENTGTTFALNASTGSWNLRGGTVQGGIYSAAAGAELLFTDAGGTLDGITAAGDLNLSQYSNAHAHVVNGLTLDNSTIWLGNALGTTYGGLSFQGSSTLGGTGEVVFGKHSSSYINTYNIVFDDPAAGTLTIGPDITIRGSSGSISDSVYAGLVHNQGTISADDSGGLSTFDYDRDVTGGSPAVTGSAIVTAGVTNAAPELVYQSARTWNQFSYTLTGLTAGSDYTLRLHFAEIMDANVGDRKFHVVVNGTRLLDDFDIRAEAGAKNKALVRDLTATADPEGKVTVDFEFGSAGSPSVNGIELLNGATVLQDIDAGNASGGAIVIAPKLINEGALEVRNGELLDIRNLSGNVGNIKLFGAGSRVALNGTDYVLNQGLEVGNEQEATLAGTWSNTGTFKITNGELNLGGTFATAELGTFDRNGGTVNLTGTLDNTGSTLTLNGATGSWNLLGGTIQNGNYAAEGGAQLAFTSTGGSLDGLTAQGDLDLTQGWNANVQIVNGLTLDNSKIWIGNALGTLYGGLSFHATSALAGTGEVVFGKHSSNYLNTYNQVWNDPAAGTLTIGPGITIRGSSGSISDSVYAGRVNNQGTIAADDSGGLSTFGYDRDVTGGSSALTGSTIVTSGVTNAAPQLVYQTGRSWGEFTYTLGGLTSGSNYTLRLHFAEIVDANAGERLFDVSVNGSQVLDEFDIVAEAGAKNKALVRDFTATADQDGNVIVSFNYGASGYPLLNGLELLDGATQLHAIDAGQAAGGTILINSELTNSGTLKADATGVLTIVNFTGTNTGTIHAGAGTTVNIQSSYAQAATGKMEIEIGGTASEKFGKVAIGGTATFDGTLSVAIVDGYVPAISDTVTPITFGSSIGQFATLESTGMPGGVAVAATYNASDVTLDMVAGLRGQVSRVPASESSIQPVDIAGVRSLLVTAIGQWCGEYTHSSRCDELQNVEIVIANLGDDYLGFARTGRIWIDDDGAGLGWLLDDEQDDSNYDLLSVLLHEVGHLLGVDHHHGDDEDSDLMSETLAPGVRHSVTQKELDAAFGDDHDWL